MLIATQMHCSTPTQWLAQVATAVNLVRNEGVLALYSGLFPSLMRGLAYGGEPPQRQGKLRLDAADLLLSAPAAAFQARCTCGRRAPGRIRPHKGPARARGRGELAAAQLDRRLHQRRPRCRSDQPPRPCKGAEACPSWTQSPQQALQRVQDCGPWWTASSGVVGADAAAGQGQPIPQQRRRDPAAVREQGLRGLWVGSTPSMVTAWATPACAWPMTGGCHCCACNAQPCSAALHTGLPAAAHGSHLCTG